LSIFKELQRRNVFRVALGYVVSSWLLAQVADLVLDNIGAPAWVMQTIMLVLALGFPVVVFFSWAYEVTPDGIKRESEVDRAQSITHITARKLDRAIIAVLILAVAYFVFDKFFLSPAQEVSQNQTPAQTVTKTASGAQEPLADANPSIAVLPFVNMSDDKDYFADGLSEELLNMLANIPGLKVAGRTSSFMFKGRNEDLREIGQALGVANILEGSVRRSGERLRITAQLVKADDGFHIWSETYDRRMADVFDIQDDVAQAISKALKVHLLPPEDRPTDNTGAYALYLEATAMMQGADWSRVLQVLDAALALDPKYARAWELKAAYYWFQGNGTIDNSEAQRLTFAAASQALALDPGLVAARAYAASSDAVYSLPQEYDALSELVRLQPNNLIGIGTLRWDMVYMGYFARALELADQALAVDPLSPIFPGDRGDALMALGRREEALVAWQLSVERGNTSRALTLASAEILAGNDQAAAAWLERYLALTGLGPWDASAFIAHARDPDTGKAFLDSQISGVVDNLLPASVDDLNRRANWYLVFGYLDDYWRVMEQGDLFGNQGWSAADNLLFWGTVFHESGFTAHPKYQRFANQFLAEVWEARGAPDLCRKSQEQWVCD